jgi:hypothetical protein
MFTHSVRTRANAIKFAHQSLCSPKISTLLKAVRRGFLKGCPNLSDQLILKYLNPSAATAKGHMKCPRHGIRSTRTRPPVTPTDESIHLEPVPVILPLDIAHEFRRLPLGPNLIADDKEQSIANIFCFGAFADRQSGIVYHDLTGSFPFMSFDGSVCFFVLYWDWDVSAKTKKTLFVDQTSKRWRWWQCYAGDAQTQINAFQIWFLHRTPIQTHHRVLFNEFLA